MLELTHFEGKGPVLRCKGTKKFQKTYRRLQKNLWSLGSNRNE